MYCLAIVSNCSGMSLHAFDVLQKYMNNVQYMKYIIIVKSIRLLVFTSGWSFNQFLGVRNSCAFLIGLV